MSVLGTVQEARGVVETGVSAGVSLASRTWFLIVAWIVALSMAPVEPASLLGAALLTLYLYG